MADDQSRSGVQFYADERILSYLATLHAPHDAGPRCPAHHCRSGSARGVDLLPLRRRCSTAFRGVQIARGLSSLSSSLSWSGLAGRSSFSNLQALATNSARSYVTNRFRAFGVASRMWPNLP